VVYELSTYEAGSFALLGRGSSLGEMIDDDVGDYIGLDDYKKVRKLVQKVAKMGFVAKGEVKRNLNDNAASIYWKF